MATFEEPPERRGRDDKFEISPPGDPRHRSWEELTDGVYKYAIYQEGGLVYVFAPDIPHNAAVQLLVLGREEFQDVYMYDYVGGTLMKVNKTVFCLPGTGRSVVPDDDGVFLRNAIQSGAAVEEVIF